MGIDKNCILDLFNLEKYEEIKNLVKKSDLKNKNELLNAVSTVIATENDLSAYNGLKEQYGENNICTAIKERKYKQLPVLLSEIDKIKN